MTKRRADSVWYAGQLRSPAGIAAYKKRARARARRQIRLEAGGIALYLGYAPTLEAAQQLRARTKKEAPRAR